MYGWSGKFPGKECKNAGVQCRCGVCVVVVAGWRIGEMCAVAKVCKYDILICLRKYMYVCLKDT